jgi:hypothetical protein
VWGGVTFCFGSFCVVLKAGLGAASAGWCYLGESFVLKFLLPISILCASNIIKFLRFQYNQSYALPLPML